MTRHDVTCRPGWCHNDQDHAICHVPGCDRHLPCRHHDPEENR